MSEQKYELAFYGKLIEGALLQGTKEQVALLFKTSVDQIERMFTGSRVVIRNKLDQDTAFKYIVALKKRGALCQIEEMGQPGIAVNFDSIAAVPVAATVPGSSQVNAQPISGNTSQTQKPVQSPAPISPKTSGKASMSVTGLPIVGDKVDDILRATQFDLAPVGARLEDKKQDTIADLHALDNVSLAPVGSVLVDHKEDIPISVPDTSHIQLASKE